MARRHEHEAVISGVLPVVKEPGPTSHDVVQVARRVLKERQIGHTGTLDPAAGGVLVLCIGAYTKLVPYLTECDKVYRGWIALGAQTDTDDSEGTPQAVRGAEHVTLEQACEASRAFLGDIEQFPPRYAAIKVGGKKLYEYAREGKEVEIEARRVKVHSWELSDLQPMEAPRQLVERGAGDAFEGKDLRKVAFVTRVSSGTYVRALARDLGNALGCGGYLLELWRDSVGPYEIDQAMPLETLRSHPEQASEFMKKGAAALDVTRYPMLTLIRGFMGRFFNGQPLNEKMIENTAVAAAVPSGAVCGVVSEEGALLGLVQAERFDAQRRANVFDSRFDVHLRPLRIFPGGLQ